jgi:hypothetical protein
VLLAASSARAEERTEGKTKWGTFGVDMSFMVNANNEPRSDYTFHHVMTPRYHVAVGRAAVLSVGAGLPIGQFFMLAALIGGKHRRSSGDGEAVTFGLGATVPLHLWLFTEGHHEDGVAFSFGVKPMIATATVCAFDGNCPGRKAYAGVGGVVGEIGVGHGWKSGAFVRVAYETGHLWPLFHAGGVPALDGIYHGVGLQFGLAFGP